MKIIFMGTPEFAVPSLEALLKSKEEIIAVVSQPDRPIGRHALLFPTKVKETALKYGLTIYEPEKASDPKFIENLRKRGPDLIVVAAYGKILKKELLDIPKYGCINIHASLLPRWRGAAPIPWAIISGDEYTGVTTMQISEELDKGDILRQKKVKISEEETSASLSKRLSLLGGDLIVETLKDLKSGRLSPIKQDDLKACYAPILKKEMGRIDWSESASRIERQVRAFSPWPGSFGYVGGKLIKIIKAALNEVCRDIPLKFSPGTVFINDYRMFVMTGEGFIEILKLQPAGKKIMNAGDFLRGHFISAFDR